MAQLKAVVAGIGDAARALNYPVISGNVSLYNDTDGVGIYPTPVIGGVGLLDDHEQRLKIGLATGGLSLLHLGAVGSWLGRSQYLLTVEGVEAGAPPLLDLALEKTVGELVTALNQQGLLAACHDISDGGLLVALAEIWLASSPAIALKLAGDLPSDAGFWFGEDQARYIIATADPDAVIQAATAAGVQVQRLGESVGDADADGLAKLTLPDGSSLTRAELTKAHEGWLVGYMEG
jgi:phosphoribosylformylglycinamidine synthase